MNRSSYRQHWRQKQWRNTINNSNGSDRIRTGTQLAVTGLGTWMFFKNKSNYWEAFIDTQLYWDMILFNCSLEGSLSSKAQLNGIISWCCCCLCCSFSSCFIFWIISIEILMVVVLLIVIIFAGGITFIIARKSFCAVYIADGIVGADNGIIWLFILKGWQCCITSRWTSKWATKTC